MGDPHRRRPSASAQTTAKSSINLAPFKTHHVVPVQRRQLRPVLCYQCRRCHPPASLRLMNMRVRTVGSHVHVRTIRRFQSNVTSSPIYSVCRVRLYPCSCWAMAAPSHPNECRLLVNSNLAHSQGINSDQVDQACHIPRSRGHPRSAAALSLTYAARACARPKIAVQRITRIRTPRKRLVECCLCKSKFRA